MCTDACYRDPTGVPARERVLITNLGRANLDVGVNAEKFDCYNIN